MLPDASTGHDPGTLVRQLADHGASLPAGSEGAAQFLQSRYKTG